MRRQVGGIAVALALALVIEGCSEATPGDDCNVGYAPGVDLTVRYADIAEPGLKVCFDGYCSRIFPPRLPNSSGYDDNVSVVHRGRGTWTVGFRKHTPATLVLEFYNGRTRLSTSTLQLAWPKVDPCSTTPLPPAPHPTVTVP